MVESSIFGTMMRIEIFIFLLDFFFELMLFGCLYFFSSSSFLSELFYLKRSRDGALRYPGVTLVSGGWTGCLVSFGRTTGMGWNGRYGQGSWELAIQRYC